MCSAPFGIGGALTLSNDSCPKQPIGPLDGEFIAQNGTKWSVHVYCVGCHYLTVPIRNRWTGYERNHPLEQLMVVQK